MSWFLYGDQKSRRKRKGVCLRVRNLDDYLLKRIDNTSCLRPGEKVFLVTVVELRPRKQVLLEIQAEAYADVISGKQRSNVFHIVVDEDEGDEWICEGDIGRGWVD